MILVIVFYVFYSFSTDLLTKYLIERELITENIANTLWSLFTIIEFCSFAFFFYFNLRNNLLKKLIISTIIAFIIFCITNLFLRFSAYDNMDTIPVTFQAIFIMTLCVIYFFEQIRNPKALFIYSTSEFWIVTGILVYLAGTFFIFIYSSNLTQAELDKYWPINYVFNTLKNILFGLGIYIHGRNQRKTVEKNPFDYYSVLENP